MVKGYKLAKPDGYDFYTGNTINYRDNIGKTVICPGANPELGLCSSGVIHASAKPDDCFVGASIPCSAYRVEGEPVCVGKAKWGFTELRILEEITNLDKLFGWNYTEACNPFNPLSETQKVKPEHLDLLKQWASVRASVRASVGASVRASVWASVGASVGASVWASVGDSVRGYIGSLFPSIKKWAYGEYPFQPAVDLWYAGFVPSYDGRMWRLHSGKNAQIVWEGKI